MRELAAKPFGIAQLGPKNVVPEISLIIERKINQISGRTSIMSPSSELFLRFRQFSFENRIAGIWDWDLGWGGGTEISYVPAWRLRGRLGVPWWGE